MCERKERNDMKKLFAILMSIMKMCIRDSLPKRRRTMHKEIYENPLCGRYASREMQRIFSPDNKFSTWRRLWIALAESEKELGLAITDAQIEEMKQHIDDIDYDKAVSYTHLA